MTTNLQAPAFDTGPLSWVIGEIHDALASSGAALRDASGRSAPAQPTLLLHAKTHLHQAHGALQMVDVAGVGLLTRAAEQALDRFKDGALACDAASARVVTEAFQAVSEYLDELLAGHAPQPLRLFPYHRALQELLGAQRIHPSDLLDIDLAAASRFDHATAAEAPDYAACRARFEKALLPYLKSADTGAQRSHAQALHEAIAPIAPAQIDPQARTFWHALHTFAGLAAQGQLASDLYVKQLFGQVNLEVRRLSQGQSTLPEALLRDALFFIAAAAPDEEARRLRQAFCIDGAVPADYHARRYGRIDAGALRQVKEALAQAKAEWDRLAADPEGAQQPGIAAALSTLAKAGEKLGEPALAQLLGDLARASGVSLQATHTPQFCLEMASAMLFVEHGLAQVRQLPADFAAHAQAVGARLLALAAGELVPAAPQWQGALVHQAQQDQTVAVLAGEIRNSLGQVEKLLDDYYADALAHAALAQAEPLLHQLEGAFAILDQDQALRTVRDVKEKVRALAAGSADAGGQLENAAANITALGFFTDMLGQNSDMARGRFMFDQAVGLLRERPAGSMDEPGEAAAELPVEAPAQPAPQAQGEAAIEAELLEIFIGEAQEVLAFVAETLPAAHAQPSSADLLAMLRRSFHTLKGSGRMVGLEQFASAAAAIERVMNMWLAEARGATPDLLALLGTAHTELSAWVAELAATGASARSGEPLAAASARVQEGQPFGIESADPAPAEMPPTAQAADDTKRIGTLEIALPLYNIYLGETNELVRLLEQDFVQWRDEPQRPVTAAALKAVHTLAGTSATVGFTALREVAAALEDALGALAEGGATLEHEQRELVEATLAQAQAMLQSFAQGELAAPQPDLVGALDALRETLACQQSVPAAGDAEPGLREHLDALFTATYDSLVATPEVIGEAAPAPQAPRLDPAVDAVDSLFDDHAAERLDSAVDNAPTPSFDEPRLEMPCEPEPVAEAAAHTEDELPVAAETESLVVPALQVFADELDGDLLPVFLEEAVDLFPQIGTSLRQWLQNPADSTPAQALLRTLHTVKGSARMAGAMRLGQHTHELETQVGNMAHAGTTNPAAFDELMANYDQAVLLLEQLQQPAAGAQGVAASAPTPAAEDAGGTRTPLVRVRADILDRLVNQAGEVSITRSRLENQVGSLKFALTDFSEQLGRLRRHLREVEMQAESQIASRLSIAGEREFDPLEFDRFTRLQELTRMMAEGVNDVAAFQESLARTVDSAGEDLATQSRLTRELQRDLMRVRMVPFASLSDRLFRVARQTAKETDKRVNLDIRGGAVEIDRSVLEQMAAPFEHLLRNAIVHGIEPRARRLDAAKPDTGELLVQVSQHGNEVAIEFSDDGAGLDLARIRDKARAAGLLALDAEVSDLEAADLIFEPGFSTAESLTELAGRGVGMDVVRSEAQALGGRVAVASTPGKGARFTIRLPLTLAVTQVVLVAAGGRTHALPAALVEQVLQVREAELAQGFAEGALQVQGQPVALRYLPTLLGEATARSSAQRSCPVMVLGSGAERIALQVDEVLGNREVVVKNTGPQLARLAGIAGATVLGSGEIVLILNPLALAHQAAQQRTAPGAAVAPSPRRTLIMVVDDSLTVRKVSQRLLEREGYQVLLAKDGVDALEQLQQSTPDLMLVDIEMPRMDGFDLTRHVRGNEKTQAIPIIMVTSRTADKHRNYALGLGVNAYFGKPFQEPILLAAISGLLDADVAIV